MLRIVATEINVGFFVELYVFSLCIKFSCWSSIRNSYHNPRRFFLHFIVCRKSAYGILCWSSRLVHSQCSHNTIAKKHANHFLVQVQLRICNTVKYNEAVLIYIILSQEVFFLHCCMQKISVGFLIEVQLSVHFTYKYTNAIITNSTIQHTKENLWKTIIHSPFLQPTCSKCIDIWIRKQTLNWIKHLWAALIVFYCFRTTVNPNFQHFSSTKLTQKAF